MAAAFTVAGFRDVIGTQWPIDDHVSKDLAKDFYSRLRTDSDRPARALHRSRARLRANYPVWPVLWASHLHIGP